MKIHTKHPSQDCAVHAKGHIVSAQERLPASCLFCFSWFPFHCGSWKLFLLPSWTHCLPPSLSQPSKHPFTTYSPDLHFSWNAWRTQICLKSTYGQDCENQKPRKKMLAEQGVVFSMLKKAYMIYFRLASFWPVSGPVLICFGSSDCDSPGIDIAGGMMLTLRCSRFRAYVIIWNVKSLPVKDLEGLVKGVSSKCSWMFISYWMEQKF